MKSDSYQTDTERTSHFFARDPSSVFMMTDVLLLLIDEYADLKTSVDDINV